MTRVALAGALLLAACGGKQSPQPTPQLDDGSGSSTPTTAGSGSGSAAPIAGGPTCELEHGGVANVDCGLAWLESFSTRMCACTTQDCAKAVSDDLATWSNALPASVQGAEGTKEQNDKGTALGEEIAGCIAKLYPGDGTTGSD